MLRTLLILGRVSNLPTVWTNVVVGWLIGGGTFSLTIGWLLLGVSLLYWAGMTLNDAFDAKWDRQHAPERPIPSGAISLTSVWGVGWFQMLAGVVLILWKTDARWEILLGLVVSIVAYDWIHKQWKGSVLIMGLCRALVYLLAWSSALASMQLRSTSALVYLLGAGSLLYIAGLSLAARSERSGGTVQIGVLPRLLLLFPTTFPVATYYSKTASYSLVLIGIVVSSVWIVFVRSWFASGKIPQGIGYAIAGIALYDAAVGFLIDWRAGVFCLLCFGITLLAQRLIPPT